MLLLSMFPSLYFIEFDYDETQFGAASQPAIGKCKCKRTQLRLCHNRWFQPETYDKNAIFTVDGGK